MVCAHNKSSQKCNKCSPTMVWYGMVCFHVHIDASHALTCRGQNSRTYICQPCRASNMAPYHYSSYHSQVASCIPYNGIPYTEGFFLGVRGEAISHSEQLVRNPVWPACQQDLDVQGIKCILYKVCSVYCTSVPCVMYEVAA